VGFCEHSWRSDLDAQIVHPAFQCRWSACCFNSTGMKVLIGDDVQVGTGSASNRMY
jgi:hypothetical protein